MLISYKFDVKSNDEFLKKYEDKYKDEQYKLSISEEVSGLFKSKKFTYEVVTLKDIIKSAKKYLDELSIQMGIEMKYEVNFKNNTLFIMIISNNNNILIGKDGRTLRSLELILKKELETTKYNYFIDLDIQNYKHKKNSKLEKEVKKLCNEVLNLKNEIKLDPMNAYERRIVHNVVSEFQDLSSESFGENEERYTIIKYKG